MLLRHGNTFEPGDPIRWLGEQDDPPLTAMGQAQIYEAGQALARAGLIPRLIYSAPYQRTYAAARIVADCCRVREPVRIEERLRELNYGGWNGLTNEEIELRDGAEPLKAWLDQGVWPTAGDWCHIRERIESEAIGLAEDLLISPYAKQGPTLLVSTNGRLRFFLKLVPGAFEK